MLGFKPLPAVFSMRMYPLPNPVQSSATVEEASIRKIIEYYDRLSDGDREILNPAKGMIM